jgi:hypothetical protein
MDEMLPLDKFAEDGEERDTRSHKYRWPIINSPYPRWHYITAVVVSEDLWGGLPPTDREIEIVTSFHDHYINYWYRVGWLNQMRAKYPFDVDGGANGRFLIKRGENDWAWRQRSWCQGPIFVPGRNESPLTLLGCLDGAHTICGEIRPHWAEWKAARPEIFGGDR